MKLQTPTFVAGWVRAENVGVWFAGCTLPGGIKGKMGDPSRSAHSAIEYVNDTVKYNKIGRLIYASSQTCCQMLLAFNTLKGVTWTYLTTKDLMGSIDPPLPRPYRFEMHRYGKTGPDTTGKFAQLIKDACKGSSTDERQMPAAVTEAMKEFNKEVNRLVREQMTREQGIHSTNDDMLFFGLFSGLLRGLGRALFKEAVQTDAKTIPIMPPKVAPPLKKAA